MANVMSEELIHGYAKALFTVVQAEGEIDRVEDELFRFGKLLETNNELKQALSDQSIDSAQRKKVLDELLADKVSPHTLGLLGFVALELANGLVVELRVSASAKLPPPGSRVFGWA